MSDAFDALRLAGFRTKVITKDGRPYMRRVYLIDRPSGGLMLHHLCQPDSDRWAHDHPWWFCAIVLRGGYTQQRSTRQGGMRTTTVQRVNFVGRRTFHRIETVEPDTWTLVVTGRRWRTWGYRVPWTEATPEHWQ